MTKDLALICVLIISFQIKALNSLDFRTTVSNWQDSFKSSDFCKGKLGECNGQISDARKEGNKYKNPDNNTRAAVEMINIYTSHSPATFKAANAVLRGNTKDVSSTDETMLREFATNLEKSIEILCNEDPTKCGKHSNVYRAQTGCDIINESSKYHTFDSFLSTSKKLSEAEKFYRDQCVLLISVLFHLSDVQGIYVGDISAHPTEEEVLVKPKSKFKIDRHITNNQKNRQAFKLIIDNLGGKVYPSFYFKGTMIGFTSASSALSGPKFVGTALSILAVYYTFFST